MGVAPTVISIQSGHDLAGLHRVLSGAMPGVVWVCGANRDVLRCAVSWHADSAAELVARARAYADERQRSVAGVVEPFVVVLDAEQDDAIAARLDELSRHPSLSLVLMYTT